MGAAVFNAMEIDAIGEIMNISLGASATALSTLLGAKVNITTPVVKVLTRQEFAYKELEPAVGVEISYVKGLIGQNIMMFSRNDVRIIVGMMMGMEIPPEEFEMDEMNESAIREVMNQMMGSSATALSEFLSTQVDISTPRSFEVPSEQEFKDKYFSDSRTKVVVRFTMEIENKLSSEFLNIMSVGLVKELLKPFGEQFGLPLSEDIPEESAESQDIPGAETAAELLSAPASPEASVAPAAPAPAAASSETSKSNGAPLDQKAADALLANLLQQAAEEAKNPNLPWEESSEETVPEKTGDEGAGAAGGVSPERTAPASAPAFGTPYPAVAAIGGYDPVMLQLLNQMQQSQLQMMELMKSMQESGKRSESAKKEAKERESTVVRPLNRQEYLDLPENGEELEANREMLMKVPLEISVEIGRTKKPVKDILEYTQGSLVVLDKMAGEQADLYVNGECIARGDIVVVEDNFGIRITEILNKELNPESLR